MIRYRVTNFILNFFSNASTCTVDYLNGLFFCISSLNGADKDAKRGINLLNWLIDHISDFISLIQLGSFRFLIASDLCISGIVPFASILNPNHSML